MDGSPPSPEYLDFLRVERSRNGHVSVTLAFLTDRVREKAQEKRRGRGGGG